MDNSIYAQLNLFRLIAAAGSITAAARQLGITTPSASQGLKQLEAKIGVPLFIRSTRSIHLTEAGEQLLARTADALLTLHQAVDEARQAGDEPSGCVRITLSRFAYQLILRPVFADFCRRYPQLQLEISIHDGTIDLISSGFDLGIRFGNGWKTASSPARSIRRCARDSTPAAPTSMRTARRRRPPTYCTTASSPTAS